MKKITLVTTAAVAMLILSGGGAQADPPPPPAPPSPAPGLSPDAAQAYQRQWERMQSYPCGLSIQSDPMPHWAF
ncbi:hypothetical protein H7J83_24015 [Mycobacterium mantenii]|uniref:hypothetical protein n=1 Tax=Mycobacterium mantenii TaxID=560555 RepID=UPI001301ED70|nr:hypothetical protein [Mycobacterium mantenii]MCV7245752.1 hypothetical protein [Mycobacterium mantenii]